MNIIYRFKDNTAIWEQYRDKNEKTDCIYNRYIGDNLSDEFANE